MGTGFACYAKGWEDLRPEDAGLHHRTTRRAGDLEWVSLPIGELREELTQP